MKTNGFNLEDMSLTDLKKIRLMISLVVVAYILAIRERIIQQKVQKVRIIKYKNGDKYPAVSVFRNGLQIVSNQIVSWFDLDNYLSLIKKKNIQLSKLCTSIIAPLFEKSFGTQAICVLQCNLCLRGKVAQD